MKLISLHSVGSVIDADTGMVYPALIDGTPDLHCGSSIEDNSPDDEWVVALSLEDVTKIVEIVKALEQKSVACH